MSFLPKNMQIYTLFKNNDHHGKYESLRDQTADSEAHPVARPRSYTPSRWNTLYAFSSGLFAAVFIFILYFLTLRILTPTPKTAVEIESESWNSCGRSSKVAMARGCVMEPLFYGWMPPQCAWKQLSDQFPVFEDRAYFQHENLTAPIPAKDLWMGKHAVVYTTKYHDEHCLFQWRKLHFAVDERKEFLDNKTVNALHTKHCADQLSNACEKEGEWSEVQLGFYKCRKTIW